VTDRQTSHDSKDRAMQSVALAKSGLLLLKHEVYSMDGGDPDIIPRYAMHYGSAYYSAVELGSFALGAAE